MQATAVRFVSFVVGNLESAVAWNVSTLITSVCARSWRRAMTDVQEKWCRYVIKISTGKLELVFFAKDSWKTNTAIIFREMTQLLPFHLFHSDILFLFFCLSTSGLRTGRRPIIEAKGTRTEELKLDDFQRNWTWYRWKINKKGYKIAENHTKGVEHWCRHMCRWPVIAW